MDRADIRILVAKALSINSMVACSQVSKAWNSDFTQYVWYGVDLELQPRFKDLDPRIIAKHGHHIKVVKNIKKRSELDLFMDPSIKNLDNLTVRLKNKDGFCRQVIELIRQNLCSLTKLSITGEKPNKQRTPFDLADALTPKSTANEPSKIVEMTIEHLSMSRASFSTVLSLCPALKELDLQDCSILGDGDGKAFFQHMELSWLLSTSAQVFKPDPELSTEPLLVHFPKLLSWDIWNPSSPHTIENAELIKSTITKYCPDVRRYFLNDISSASTQTLLTKAIEKPTLLCVEIVAITPSVIMGIIQHKATLEELRTYDPRAGDWDYCVDDVFQIEDKTPDKWMIHLILSKCSAVKCIKLPSHEMDLDHVQHFPWACKDIKDVRVRVKGLDTKELILATIKKWGRGCYARRRANASNEASKIGGITKETEAKHETAASTVATVTATAADQKSEDNSVATILAEDEGKTTTEETETEIANPIVDKMAAHLLKFENLTTVWLGYKLWTLQ
ncbi:hypothetical protein BX616_011199 [Lobosporangium transversale]|uniref:F-box domain-containing protein n=1 Tax=Lobosporangium transversale TaxID=64571 RepID=A0A1Y2GAK1_9FUNG|nr:hypothetical protein BCR41DRAFT_361682 [Lobosporangium transversale]KAF9909389.1 hypothetical protein BX616_011199 [Lobosporangium transversale]ORZ05491.1 hypothetical protein BCR41DRAFT_361682 [Lobosporangium transversale]|eukprot:XP_021877065.1 hypothetical protein BCR41DRAFT_361682 [Lobosporangium transversale]